MGATRCQHFMAKMHQVHFPWGPHVGVYSAPQNPLAECKGPTYKEMEGKGSRDRRRDLAHPKTL